ncbi:unnamed protein product, partial [Owenia fusiformis]
MSSSLSSIFIHLLGWSDLSCWTVTADVTDTAFILVTTEHFTLLSAAIFQLRPTICSLSNDTVKSPGGQGGGSDDCLLCQFFNVQPMPHGRSVPRMSLAKRLCVTELMMRLVR